MPARDSLACGGLPIGLAHGTRLARAINKGMILKWNDVAVTDSEIIRFRREMESLFAAEWGITRLPDRHSRLIPHKLTSPQALFRQLDKCSGAIS